MAHPRSACGAPPQGGDTSGPAKPDPPRPLGWGRRVRHRDVFLPVFISLVVVAWFALWAWARSPYGRYLDHGDWTVSGPAAFLCRAIPGGAIVVRAVLYGTAWILMTAAMML